MAFTDTFFTLAGLCEIVLPSRTIRLCDGAYVIWTAASKTFYSSDSVFGVVESISEVTESVGDEAPGGSMTLLPPDIVAAGDLFQPDAQGSSVKFWLTEVDPNNFNVLGTPELQFSGFLDQLTLTLGKSRKVDVTFISEGDRLFWTKEGNVLSPRFHKTVWAGELGLDFATGSQLAVPWGVTGPPRGDGGVFTGGGVFGGGILGAWLGRQ